jgi:site-specific DNA-methyltransferase (adenine-specific)
MGDAWRLSLGDCLAPDGLASLADGSVDHVICDPPYEAEAHTKARRAAHGSDFDSARAGAVAEYAIGFDAITEEQRCASAAQMVRVSRGWVIAFCQVEAVSMWRAAFTAAGASWRRACAWVKPDGAPQFTGDRPAQGFECIACAWAGGGRSEWNGGGKRGVYELCVNDFGRIARPHPTSKPEALMEALIRDFTDPNDLICDPFAGSGTTGVAAIRHGRRFIGWERDPKYHAVATKRLSAAREQLRMFEGVAGAAATSPTALSPAPRPAIDTVVSTTRRPVGQGAPTTTCQARGCATPTGGGPCPAHDLSSRECIAYGGAPAKPRRVTVLGPDGEVIT